jgi:branched-chain amino acid transport system permease protein
MIRFSADRRLRGWLQVAALLALAASLPLWLATSSTLRDTATLTVLYMAAAVAWNIIGGFGGQLSFGNSIFFGIGAYATALLLLKAQVNPWLGILAGAAIAVGVSTLLGLLTFRLRGFYFSLTTFTLTLTVELLAVHFSSLTGGANGLVEPLGTSSLLNLAFANPIWFYYVGLAFTVITGLVAYGVYRSRLGLHLRAIRDDEDAARASGVSALRVKLVALIISAVLTAIVGGIYVQYIGFIDPPSAFGETLAVQIVILAFVGGLGTLWGPFVGAAVLVPLQQIIGTSFSSATSGVNLVIYGVIVVVIITIDPRGLVPLAKTVGGKARARYRGDRDAGASAGDEGPGNLQPGSESVPAVRSEQ